MPSLAEVIRRHGPGYKQRHGSAILPSHRRALDAIVQCRTAALGGHLALCEACGREHLFYHSCRHRACPQCGYAAALRWTKRQEQLLLPVPYFHVVFTLPAELRRIVRSHQKQLLPVLFRAAFDSLQALCMAPKYLGGHIGALAVLHTWTRTLEWHPHVHLLVPGGALAADGRTWLSPPSRKQAFLVPVKALGVGFRGRFMRKARRALPDVEFPASVWDKPWVVFSKPALQGAEQVLRYLGRYVQRTAITDRSILSVDDSSVTFRYRDNRDGCRKTMRLGAQEFLRRFLQHVPPKGFHRVRAFGLLSSARRNTLRRLQLLLDVAKHEHPAEEAALSKPEIPCPHCGETSLRFVRRLSAAECAVRVALAEQGVPRLRKARGPPVAKLKLELGS